MPTTYGILSTYPPTQCGLATFSLALAQSLASERDVVSVVEVVDDRDGAPRRSEVRHQWVRGQEGGAAAAAARLNAFDVVIVQHEYGIFGGADGADVLEVVRAVSRPVIVVLHTVLAEPSEHQRAILDELVLLAHTVVTMTQTAKDRLLSGYAPAEDKIRIIPHGAFDIRLDTTGDSPVEGRDPHAPPVVLTWGLLGEGKGIEWGIAAMAQLCDLDPAPQYRIVGETHPKVLQRDGEVYRRWLETRAREFGVHDAVSFDARYLETSALSRLVSEADVVLLPYDSPDQVTSGVLVEAVTAGKPVVSTGFPHAVELLSGGAGLLVERQDPDAIAVALRRVFTEPGLAASMAVEANRLSPQLLWGAVGQQYRDAASFALRDRSIRASA